MNEIVRPLFVELGKEIKFNRKKKRMSLEALGNLVGKSKATIKRHEDGTSMIDGETLRKICLALDFKPRILERVEGKG